MAKVLLFEETLGLRNGLHLHLVLFILLHLPELLYRNLWILIIHLLAVEIRVILLGA